MNNKNNIIYDEETKQYCVDDQWELPLEYKYNFKPVFFDVINTLDITKHNMSVEKYDDSIIKEIEIIIEKLDKIYEKLIS